MTEGNFVLGGLALFAAWIFIGLPLLHNPIETSEFLGLSAEGWIAVGTLLLAAVTLFLGLVGLQQLNSARQEARSNRTLAAVERYDFDPVLDGCLRRLRAARLAGEPPNKTDAVTLLNSLEAIAIGIEQGIYDEVLAKEHMVSILVKTYERYLGPDGIPVAEVDPVNYIPLRNLYIKWSRT